MYQLFESTTPLTFAVNQHYRQYHRDNPFIEKEDLLQEALLWYHSQRLSQVDTQFPWYHLKNHLQNYSHQLQKQQGVYLPRKSLTNQVKKFSQAFYQKYHRFPNFSEIQERFNLSKSQLNRIFFRSQISLMPQSLDSVNSDELRDFHNSQQGLFYEEFKQFLLKLLSDHELLILNTEYLIFPLQPTLTQDTYPKNYKQKLKGIIQKIRRKMNQTDWLN